jgi:alcohol dehydrogenase (cytochrome c)
MPGNGSLKRLMLVAASSAALAVAATAVAAQDAPIDRITPVTDEMLLNPPEGDWLMWRRTLDGFGFSPLDQITKENVKDLRVAWAWSMTPGRTEATPLVHDGILYLFHYGNKVQALDGASGDLIWEYAWVLPEDLTAAGGNQSMRSMGVYGNNLIVPTVDAHILALDLKTGQLAWDVQVADWSKGWRYSSGPTIADGIIVQGMTGCGNAQPGGCFVTGHDANTGEEKWRFYTIARPGTPEDSTWNGLPLESRFGGSAWIAGAYDPEQKLIFMGVGQPYPWIAEMSGLLPPSTEEGVSNDALYTDATLALDIETGELAWHYQHLKNDTLDLDHVYERMLIDLPVDGTDRKTVVSVGKIGIVEALDRTNGQWLWGKETVPQNVVASIDPKTGEKTINQDALPHIGQTTMNCPADPGGRGWAATAYNPDTHRLYLPLAEFCSNTTPQPLDQGQVYTGGGRATFARVPVPDSDGNIGRIDAIDLTDQSEVWSYRQRPPITSSVLPTAGGLVFAGGLDRKFYAFDDATGDILWSSKLSNAVNSFPISYMADGKQYIAVVAADDSGLTRSWGSLTPEFKTPSDHGASLWVFALDDEAAAQ